MKDFRNRTGFSDEMVRAAIEAWLETGSLCPFAMYDNNCENFCYQVFPSIIEKDLCPCTHYTLKYVIRIAKQAIKKLGG